MQHRSCKATFLLCKCKYLRCLSLPPPQPHLAVAQRRPAPSAMQVHRVCTAKQTSRSRWYVGPTARAVRVGVPGAERHWDSGRSAGRRVKAGLQGIPAPAAMAPLRQPPVDCAPTAASSSIGPAVAVPVRHDKQPGPLIRDNRGGCRTGCRAFEMDLGVGYGACKYAPFVSASFALCLTRARRPMRCMTVVRRALVDARRAWVWAVSWWPLRATTNTTALEQVCWHALCVAWWLPGEPAPGGCSLHELRLATRAMTRAGQLCIRSCYPDERSITCKFQRSCMQRKPRSGYDLHAGRACGTTQVHKFEYM